MPKSGQGKQHESNNILPNERSQACVCVCVWVCASVLANFARSAAQGERERKGEREEEPCPTSQVESSSCRPQEVCNKMFGIFIRHTHTDTACAANYV